MTEEEIKEWDDALLDLINKEFIRVVKFENGDTGFIANVQIDAFMVL